MNVSEGDKCDRCGEIGQDRRTLWHACMYEMSEMNIPFDKRDKFYTLLVCKDCRGDWLRAIQHWFDKKPTYVEYRERQRWTP